MTSLEPPTLSEVIRRLDELRTDVRDMGGRFISTELYLVDKQVRDREAKELRERIAEVQRDQDARDLREQKQEKDIQDQAVKNRQFLLGLVASPLASALIAWIISGGLR